MLPNSGRIKINVRPREQRADDAPTIIRRLQTRLNDVKGIRLFMQPVHDLTVEDSIGRTQFQYTMEDADGKELSDWAPKLLAPVIAVQQFRDVATGEHDPRFQQSILL